MNERWVPIRGYEGIYEVSTLGRVRRLVAAYGSPAGMFMKSGHQRGGYRHVVLSRDGRKRIFKLHRLVLEHFVGPMPDGHEINHRDGDKYNNALTNLEYVTRAQNIQHAYAAGLIDRRALAHGSARLSEEDVRAIRVALNAGEARREIAQRFGVTVHAITDIALGRAWSWLR